MPLSAIYIEKADGISGIIKAGQAHGVDAAADVLVFLAGLAHAAEVSLDIRQKHRHAHVAEGFCHDLQRDGFAGAGSAGDQAVAVGHGGLQIDGCLSRRQPNFMLLL